MNTEKELQKKAHSSLQELAEIQQRIKLDPSTPKLGDFYSTKDGDGFLVVGIGMREEDEEPMVCFAATSFKSNRPFVIPLKDWISMAKEGKNCMDLKLPQKLATEKPKDDPSLPRFEQVYLHYKGTKYMVVSTATRVEDGESVVCYLGQNSKNLWFWIRPLSDWNATVEHQGNQVKRFTKTEEKDSTLTTFSSSSK